MTVLDTLKGATASRRSVTLCLDAAAQAEWDAERENLSEAAKEDEKNQSLAFEAVTRSIDKMDAIRERMVASEVTFDFERMDWPARLALQAEHPPRDNNPIDQIRGYNLETYLPAIIRHTCVAVTGADGDEATDVPNETWLHLLGDPSMDPPVKGALSFQQIDKLSGAAIMVNDGETQIPISARSLLGNRDSGASLAQPSPGKAPARKGSEGGNQRGSRKSSATKKAASSAS